MGLLGHYEQVGGVTICECKQSVNIYMVHKHPMTDWLIFTLFPTLKNIWYYDIIYDFILTFNQN